MPISEHLRLSVVSRPTFAKDLAEMLVSMLVMSFGVVLSVKAGLGASPIASLPNVISEGSGLSLGTTLVLVYSVMIVMEWAIIRDRKRILLTLSQLPFTYVFSIFVDIVSFPLEGWVVQGGLEQWAVLVASTATIGFGIVLEVDANVSMIADDGLILALHQATKIRLDKVMVIFDVCFVASAFIVSYVVFHDFVGVGLGTIFAGVTLGLFVRLFTKVVKRYIRRDGSIEVRGHSSAIRVSLRTRSFPRLSTSTALSSVITAATLWIDHPLKDSL